MCATFLYWMNNFCIKVCTCVFLYKPVYMQFSMKRNPILCKIKTLFIHLIVIVFKINQLI